MVAADGCMQDVPENMPGRFVQFFLFACVGAIIAWVTTALLPRQEDIPARTRVSRTADIQIDSETESNDRISTNAGSRPRRPVEREISTVSTSPDVASSEPRTNGPADDLLRAGIGLRPRTGVGEESIAPPSSSGEFEQLLRSPVLSCKFGHEHKFWVGIADGSAYITTDELVSVRLEVTRTKKGIHFSGVLPDGAGSIVSTLLDAVDNRGRYPAIVSDSSPGSDALIHGTCDSLRLGPNPEK
jgi:hypothetical protein